MSMVQDLVAAAPDARVAAAAGLLDALPDGILLIDTARRCSFANPAAAEIFGLARDQLLGCDVRTAAATRDLRQFRDALEGALCGQPARGTIVVRRPTGEECEVEFSMRLAAGDRPLVVAMLRDVTDTGRQARRAALLAQIASHAAFEETLKNSLDKLAEGVVQATGTVACGVCLVGKDGEFQVFGSYGIPQDPEAEAHWQAAVRRGARMPGMESIEQRRPVIHLDVRRKKLDDPAFEPIHPWLREAAWDAVVSLPLIYRGRAVGSLNVFYPREKNPGEPEVNFLTAIADQALYGIALGARTARTLLDRNAAQAAEPLDYVLALAEAGLTEMRALIFELRPETLAAEGLIAALARQIDAARARWGLDVVAQWGEEPDVAYDVKEAIYRIAQEALNNIIKHAHARRADLRLSTLDEEIVLNVSDDGIGFASEESFPGHLGLRSMRERAARLGGTLQVDSVPSQGTRIEARIPHNGKSA